MTAQGRDDGGSAFPCEEREVVTGTDGRLITDRRIPVPGMTLLDWFAGQALSGEVSRKSCVNQGEWGAAAVRAYHIAAAMLAEKRRREGGQP